MTFAVKASFLPTSRLLVFHHLPLPNLPAYLPACLAGRRVYVARASELNLEGDILAGERVNYENLATGPAIVYRRPCLCGVVAALRNNIVSVRSVGRLFLYLPTSAYSLFVRTYVCRTLLFSSFYIGTTDLRVCRWARAML